MPAVPEAGVYVNTVLLQTPAGVSVLESVGVGFTVMVKVCAAPTQPSKYGVTVMVAVTGATPPLVAIKDSISPEPEAPRPIEVLLLDHIYVEAPPDLIVVKLTRSVASPLHFTWSTGSLT